jgi:uncharacterized DUF497 family protein
LGRGKAQVQYRETWIGFPRFSFDLRQSRQCTYDASRGDKYRLMDVALAILKGKLLTLVYMEIDEDVRVISFRNASREERKQYEEDRRKDRIK